MSAMTSKNLFLVLALLTASAGCKSGSGGSDAPAPTPTNGPQGANQTTQPQTAAVQKIAFSVTAQGPGQVGDRFVVSKGSQVSVNFSVSGAGVTSPSQVAIALGAGGTATGGSLTNAASLTPAWSWSSSSASAQTSTFLLVVRDLAACQKAAGAAGAASCAFSGASVSPNDQYDTSKTYTVCIQDFGGATVGGQSGGLLSGIMANPQILFILPQILQAISSGNIQAVSQILMPILPTLAGSILSGGTTLPQLQNGINGTGTATNNGGC